MSEFRGRQAVIADLLTGAIVVLVGAAAVVASARMPTFAEQGSNPLTAPGIFPALVGVCFVVSGLILVLRSGRQLRSTEREAADGGSPISLPTVGGFLLMIATVALLGRIDIRLVLAGFCLIFCTFFVRWERERLAVQILGVAIATAISSWVFPLAFEDLFLVRMP